MSKNPDWSIIFVNFNSTDALSEALRSLSENEPLLATAEIIIADNASDKPEQQRLNKIITQYNKKITINSIFLERNYGFGAANNAAAARARGQFLLFLNPDIIYTQALLSSFAKMLATANVGLVAPLLRLRSGQPQPEACGRFPTLRTVLGRKLARARTSAFAADQLEPQRVDWVCGAAFAIRADVWRRLGGFDERYFMYFEDVDLSRRSVAAGLTNYVLPAVSLIHLGGERRQVQSWRRRYYFASQAIYFRYWHGRLAAMLLRLLRLPYQWYCHWHDPA